MLHPKTNVTLFIILLLSVALVTSPVLADQASAQAIISSAKENILTCYNAAREAEAAGANITDLTGTLNEAGLLLSKAESAYAANDFATAFNLAAQSQNLLTNFVAEANALKETAAQQQNQDYLINVVGSTIGTLIVIAIGIALWFFLKRKYETTEAHVDESPRI